MPSTNGFLVFMHSEQCMVNVIEEQVILMQKMEHVMLEKATKNEGDMQTEALYITIKLLWERELPKLISS